jgi:hypothetical protein
VANVRHLSTGYVSPQFHVVFDDLFKTMIRNGDNDAVINSICDGLFNWNRELYVKDEFNTGGLLVYKPPTLHEVWLDETAVAKGRRICFANAVGMRTLCGLRRGKPANEWTQLLLWSLLLRILFLREPPFPMMMIVISSVYSIHSEPEGEFRDDFDDDGVVHIPKPPPAPNIHEGAGPNVVPEGDDLVQAPEGAPLRRTRGLTCQYPPAKWI